MNQVLFLTLNAQECIAIAFFEIKYLKMIDAWKIASFLS